MDTNWIQRRDDVLNRPVLMNFYFARAVQDLPRCLITPQECGDFYFMLHFVLHSCEKWEFCKMFINFLLNILLSSGIL